MEILEFTNKMEKALTEYYGENAEVKIQKVYKNNDVLLYGVCIIEKDKNIAPTIYLNQFHEAYEEGESFSEIFRTVIRINEENQVSDNLDMDFFFDYENVKKRLVLRLINLEGNTELLKEVPYQKFLDLAVVCHMVLASEEIGCGAILIRREHMESWRIDEETLFRDAFNNSPKMEPYEIMKMEDVLKQLLKERVTNEAYSVYENETEAEKMVAYMMDYVDRKVEEVEFTMYVLSNKNRYFGAACIIYPQVLEEIGNLLQDDYYVIPSSVHEILVISKKKCIDSDSVNRIIEDVNWSQVDEEEWLSDHTYLYERKDKRLVPVTSP